MLIDELIHDVLLSRILIDSQVQDLMLKAEIEEIVKSMMLVRRSIVVFACRTMLGRLSKMRLRCRWRCGGRGGGAFSCGGARGHALC